MIGSTPWCGLADFANNRRIGSPSYPRDGCTPMKTLPNCLPYTLSTDSIISSFSDGASPISYPLAFSSSRTAFTESNTSRYTAVPTLPLSGGNENCYAIVLPAAGFVFRFDHLSALSANKFNRSASGMLRPVAPSRPAKIIGSIAPSISGRNTCNAT